MAFRQEELAREEAEIVGAKARIMRSKVGS